MISPPSSPLGPVQAEAAAGHVAMRTAASGCVATPFRTNAGKRTVYRIPSLVRTTKGTLVAFAERRRSTDPSADISDTEIVMARSTDRGCHWSAPKVIADQGRGTVGNPSPVVDTSTGDVLLFSIYRAPGGGTTYHGFHLQRSRDDGRTFTAYKKAGFDLAGIPGYQGGLTGPGHAIQLHAATSKHPGRIVVPMGFKVGSRYGAYAMVSDDHGKSWKVGYKSLGGDGRIEGTAAELPDGRLWISYRNRNVKTAVGRGRIAAFSTDSGSGLAGSFRNAGLPTVSVQGSALTLWGPYRGALLFSSPTRQDVNLRHGMGIFASRGAGIGRTWSKPVGVQSDSRPAAYSDLVQMDNATIGILYETGQKSWKERIDFRRLSIRSILG